MSLLNLLSFDFINKSLSNINSDNLYRVYLCNMNIIF